MPPRRVVVLVPGEDVLLSSTVLPVRGAARMLQAVPFAMEDHLADDVSDLHFALGRRDESGEVAVAVTRQECMEQWLDELTEAGIGPQALYPDTTGVPSDSGAPTLVLDDERALLRQGDGTPTACGIPELPAYLSALALEAPEDAHAQVYVSEENADEKADEIAAVEDALGGARRTRGGELRRTLGGAPGRATGDQPARLARHTHDRLRTVDGGRVLQRQRPRG